ncbi:HNH endonuclease [Chloroflexota bacterium]
MDCEAFIQIDTTHTTKSFDTPFNLVDGENMVYTSAKIKSRQRQVQFRQEVLKAYEYRCSITGEKCLDVLEAAHIQPYLGEESNHIQNGIPLRMDLHRLFDTGLITIDGNYRIQISHHLKSQEYEALNGKEIILSENKFHYPSTKALEYHRKWVFRGGKTY